MNNNKKIVLWEKPKCFAQEKLNEGKKTFILEDQIVNPSNSTFQDNFLTFGIQDGKPYLEHSKHAIKWEKKNTNDLIFCISALLLGLTLIAVGLVVLFGFDMVLDAIIIGSSSAVGGVVIVKYFKTKTSEVLKRPSWDGRDIDKTYNISIEDITNSPHIIKELQKDQTIKTIEKILNQYSSQEGSVPQENIKCLIILIEGANLQEKFSQNKGYIKYKSILQNENIQPTLENKSEQKQSIESKAPKQAESKTKEQIRS